jgi:hypothetical protein
VNEHPERELLDAYALGTLGEADAARVRAHVAACADCRAEAGVLRSVLDVLPHGLPEVRASARVRERIFAQLDASAAVRRRRPSWTFAAMTVLAAAFALAVGLDVRLAVALRRALAQPTSPAVAVASPAPQRTSPPVVPRTAVPRTAVSRTAATGLAAHRPALPASSPEPLARTPAPGASAAPPGAPPPVDPALRRRIAQLEASLTGERLRAQRDRERIELLQHQLADADASVVALERSRAASQTQPPGPVPSGVPSSAVLSSGEAPELVAALSSGRVYSVDGVVGSEPWHLTIVQPPAGKDAVIYTRTPGAPDGDTYRTWVLRGGTTFDAGELRPAAQTELEMPMPLQAGDQVAFSREPVGTGNRPTSPFLMKVTIGQ